MGCKGPIQHDEVAATKTALEFGRDAFVIQDTENAYALLSDSAKRYVTRETFKESLLKLRPQGFSVSLVEYQPVSGEERMYDVYLSVESSHGRLHYELIMERDAVTGYRVATFKPSGTPPPWSSAREKSN